MRCPLSAAGNGQWNLVLCVTGSRLDMSGNSHISGKVQLAFGRVTANLGISPLRVFQSIGLTDAAATLMRTSPLRRTGLGKSDSS